MRGLGYVVVKSFFMFYILRVIFFIKMENFLRGVWVFRVEMGSLGIRGKMNSWEILVFGDIIEEIWIFGMEMKGEREGVKFRKFYFFYNLI